MVHLMCDLKMKWFLKKTALMLQIFVSIGHNCQIKVQGMHVLVVLQLP